MAAAFNTSQQPLIRIYIPSPSTTPPHKVQMGKKLGKKKKIKRVKKKSTIKPLYIPFPLYTNFRFHQTLFLVFLFSIKDGNQIELINIKLHTNGAKFYTDCYIYR